MLICERIKDRVDACKPVTETIKCEFHPKDLR